MGIRVANVVGYRESHTDKGRGYGNIVQYA
jgi:hypothetical protein